MLHNEVPVHERMTNHHFDPRIEFEGKISTAYYRCPKCQEEVYFKTSDFQRHLFSEASNLPQAVQNYLKEHRPLSPAEGECFLDFSCPGCDLSVRIIFVPWEFRMACYGFDVKSVIELDLG